MDRTAIIKSCLEERKENLKQLQEKYNNIDFECEKAFFEEEMYQTLLERHSSKYSKTFSDKKEAYKEKTDALDKEKETRKYDMKILEKEIDYLESLFK